MNEHAPIPRLRILAGACAALLWSGCAGGSPEPTQPGAPLHRNGDEISVAGQLFHTGTHVVLWNDPGGYDAYRLHRHFDPEETAPSRAPERTARFDTYRGNLPPEIERRVRARGWTLDDLRAVISQVVIHYDACGTSRRCFEVLHDIRGLSCHFLLDLDGTIYQTLDVKERAWDAGIANDRSIGIEIANIGAYPDTRTLSAWYPVDDLGPRVQLPKGVDRGQLPRDFVARPARPRPIRGVVQGRDLVQYDYTEEQYRALEKLLAALTKIFPRIEPRAPRGPDGKVLEHVLPSEEISGFRGILGHCHVSKEKIDPGPAFDWERVLAALHASGP